MALFVTRVLKWEDSRDSSNRISMMEDRGVGGSIQGRYFILNTNRITDVIDLSTLAVPKCSFYYFDNPFDRRENKSYIECDHSAAQIIAHFDDVPASQAVTLPIVPHNQPWGSPYYPIRPTINTVIGIWALAYVDRYNPDPNNYVWVCYTKGAFKRVEVLCSIQIGWPTLTSTTTTATQRGQ
jgi:hypothetical protein